MKWLVVVKLQSHGVQGDLATDSACCGEERGQWVRFATYSSSKVSKYMAIRHHRLSVSHLARGLGRGVATGEKPFSHG